MKTITLLATLTLLTLCHAQLTKSNVQKKDEGSASVEFKISKPKTESKSMNEPTSGTSREMPRYQCHKKVWALKIAGINDPTQPGSESDGSRIITPEESGYEPFRVDYSFVHKHKPEVGGYFVVYDDGYKSFSPAKAFEEGYSKITP